MDYCGRRLVAQTMIPGILHGERATKLVYGSVDNGETIAMEDKMTELMDEAAHKLSIKPMKVIAVEREKEEFIGEAETQHKADPWTSPILFSGSAECKGIRGKTMFFDLKFKKKKKKRITY